MRIRNFRVREQIMQQRINRIVAENKRIAKGTLPRPASYFDLSEHFSNTITSTQTAASFTVDDLLQLVDSLPDEMRAGEQQSLYERLYYRPSILHTSWKMPIGGVLS